MSQDQTTIACPNCRTEINVNDILYHQVDEQLKKKYQNDFKRESSGKKFTEEQRRWLEMIRDHIAANLGIEPNDFEYAPFAQEGGLGKVHQIFGDKLNTIIEELNETLAA